MALMRGNVYEWRELAYVSKKMPSPLNWSARGEGGRQVGEGGQRLGGRSIEGSHCRLTFRAEHRTTGAQGQMSSSSAKGMGPRDEAIEGTYGCARSFVSHMANPSPKMTDALLSTWVVANGDVSAPSLFDISSKTDLELELDLVARARQRQTRPEPAHLARLVLRQSDGLVRVDDRVGSKVPPAVCTAGQEKSSSAGGGRSLE
jgi:hypothetical protein